jgi:hypothetical protein
MRYTLSMLAFFGLAGLSFSQTVSVHPPQNMPANGIKIVEGTLLPAPIEPFPKLTQTPATPSVPAPQSPKPAEPAKPKVVAPSETPAVVSHAPVLERIGSTAPIVPMPEVKDCSSCGETSCGAPLFGSLLKSGCASNFCGSTGRPSLMGNGWLTKPFLLFPSQSCKSCASDCATAQCSSGKAWTPSWAIWNRIRGWMFFQHCDGPRIPMFSFERYMPPTMFVHHSPAKNYGSCSVSGCAGANLGLGARLTGSSCATGNCGAGTGLLHGKRGPMDCNNAEPKLSGTDFCEGYRFAVSSPRVYGRNDVTTINPIAKSSKQSEPIIEKPTGLEQASLKNTNPIKAQPEPKKTVPAKSDRLSVPFSNP